MSKVAILMGASGTGKSTSLRNFKQDEICLVNVIGKELPFRGGFEETLNSDDYTIIQKFIAKTQKKIVIIDDAQYLMSNQYMSRASEKGFNKFVEIGQDFWNFINFCKSLSADVTVYFLTHTEIDADSREKIKTIGKMIDEKICLEGMFTVVLKTVIDRDKHYMISTHSSGFDTVKSPMGMFDSDYIQNDLKLVDDVIRDYYGLKTLTRCEVCGNVITATSKKTVDEIIEGTKKNLGKCTCWNCFAKEWAKRSKEEQP